MPRAPDFSLGFGFNVKNSDLGDHLDNLKKKFEGVHEAASKFEKASTKRIGAKPSIQKFEEEVEETTKRLKKSRRQSFHDFVTDLESIVEHLPKKRRLRETRDELRLVFEAVGEGAASANDLNEAILKFRKQTKLAEKEGKLKKIFEDPGAFMDKWMGKVKRWLGPQGPAHILEDLPTGILKLWKLVFRSTKKDPLDKLKRFAEDTAARMKESQPVIVESAKEIGEATSESINEQIRIVDPAEEIKSAVDKLRALVEQQFPRKLSDIPILEDPDILDLGDFSENVTKASGQVDQLRETMEKAQDAAKKGMIPFSAKDEKIIGKLEFVKKLGPDVFTNKLKPAIVDVASTMRDEFGQVMTTAGDSAKAAFDRIIRDKHTFVQEFKQNFEQLKIDVDGSLQKIGESARQNLEFKGGPRGGPNGGANGGPNGDALGLLGMGDSAKRGSRMVVKGFDFMGRKLKGTAPKIAKDLNRVGDSLEHGVGHNPAPALIPLLAGGVARAFSMMGRGIGAAGRMASSAGGKLKGLLGAGPGVAAKAPRIPTAPAPAPMPAAPKLPTGITEEIGKVSLEKQLKERAKAFAKQRAQELVRKVVVPKKGRRVGTETIDEDERERRGGGVRESIMSMSESLGKQLTQLNKLTERGRGPIAAAIKIRSDDMGRALGGNIRTADGGKGAGR